MISCRSMLVKLLALRVGRIVRFIVGERVVGKGVGGGIRLSSIAEILGFSMFGENLM